MFIKFRAKLGKLPKETSTEIPGGSKGEAHIVEQRSPENLTSLAS